MCRLGGEGPEEFRFHPLELGRVGLDTLGFATIGG